MELSTIEVTTDRSRALDGAAYAINMIQVGGYRPCTVTDFEIPKRYGSRQTIADTLGVGGIMRAVRTIPVLIDMCKDMERLCPNVVHFNYVNPMAMNCWALTEATKIQTIGLCHSVQHTAGELAQDIGVPLEEINYVVAGINHVAFFLRFERNGRDLIRKSSVFQEDGFPMATASVTTCSSDWAILSPSQASISRIHPLVYQTGTGRPHSEFNIPLDEYPRRCESQMAEWENLRKELEGSDRPLEIRRSVDTAH